MIDLANLPSMPLEQRWSLPTVQCVYFVLSSKNQVLYIGQTKNLANRWRTHTLYKALKTLNNIRIVWMQISDESLLLEVEEILINHYQPEFNLNKPQEQEAILCVKVPRSLRHHWAVEAKRTGVTMTEVIVAALSDQFGKPDIK